MTSPLSIDYISKETRIMLDTSNLSLANQRLTPKPAPGPPMTTQERLKMRLQ